jgi:ubiquinone/menaquinone biosynthesis C-methylase UbiE
MHNHTNKQTHSAETEGNTLDGMAPFYDKFVQLLTLGKEKKARLETVELAHVRSGERVLEVGCGTGSLALAAAQRVGAAGEVCGIDPAPKMIELAQRKAAKKELKVDFRIGVIESLPYADHSFDIVLSSLMMHHLPDDLKSVGMAEIYRVLKPGGRLVIVELDSSRFSLINFIHGQRTSENRLALQLKHLMQAYKFGQVEIKNMRYGSLTFLMGTKAS